MSTTGCAYFKNTQSELEQAAAALEAGDEAKAEKIYRDTMRAHGKHSEEARALLINMLINRAGRLLEKGKPEEAMGHYREALSLDETRDESRIAYARALMKLERYTEAIDALMAGKGCRGCKTMVSVIYLERGQAGVRDGEYADALTDFDMALSMNRDPLTVLQKVDVYTKGGYGTALEAVGYLDQALRIMPPDQVSAQQVWWEQRTALIYQAALNHEDPAISAALAFEDPRRGVDPTQSKVDRLQLAMYAASLQIYAQDFDQGIARGLATYAEAETGVPEDARTALREVLMGLFMQRVALHLAADEEAAARKALAQALELDPENRILNFQNVLVTAARNTGSARTMIDKWSSDPEYTRMRALIELAYVRKMSDIGQFTAAKTGLDRAEKLAPDLLDVKLMHAEWETTVRFDGLKKTWAEQFREIDTFSYPGGRINYYGRALAYVNEVEAAYDENAQRDYLRMPGFGKRLAAFKKSLEFYPYAVQMAGPDYATKGTLLLVREEDGEVEVKIAGPKQEHVVKVPGKGSVEVDLGMPGFAVVGAPAGKKAVFAEPGVKIVIAI
jgi:tetratricopeptide (TPR) repeat protein